VDRLAEGQELRAGVFYVVVIPGHLASKKETPSCLVRGGRGTSIVTEFAKSDISSLCINRAKKKSPCIAAGAIAKLERNLENGGAVFIIAQFFALARPCF
jgi:hypothetical protein